jgi:opacity protein-like surface antigen
MKKYLILATLLACAAPAAAADMPIKAAPYAAIPVCATSFCTGWYVGGGFDGNGTNADIIGSGLDNSVFGAGAIPSVQGGFQYWNGTYFIDGEVSVGYSIPTSGTVIAQRGALGIQELQVGGKLSGLLGTSSPITVPSVLTADLISLYAAIGVAEEVGATALSSGAGAKFVCGSNCLIDLGYRYLPFNSTSGNLSVKADNLVRVRFSYIFK